MKNGLPKSSDNKNFPFCRLYKYIDIVGLNSGTSGDGLDAAVVRFHRRGLPEVLLGKTYPYPTALKERIIAAGENDICNGIEWLRLDHQLGNTMGKLAKRFLQTARAGGLNPIAVASHGQTVRHLPDDNTGPLTLQIGEPAIIARKAGLPVISDFRRSDLAAGGQGAPLSPLLHKELFSHNSKWRAIVNIGGIANITLLPPLRSTYNPLAADCGPGNMMIDMAMRKLYNRQYDKGGRIALSGNASDKVVTEIMSISFFTQKPPKSTGRELFGEKMLDKIVGHFAGAALEDIIATITELTVEGITSFIERFGGRTDEIYLCGGGAKNRYITSRLIEIFPRKLISTTDSLGFDIDHLEAVLWAFLGYRFITQKPVDASHFTGAKKSYIPGKLCLP